MTKILAMVEDLKRKRAERRVEVDSEEEGKEVKEDQEGQEGQEGQEAEACVSK